MSGQFASERWINFFTSYGNEMLQAFLRTLSISIIALVLALVLSIVFGVMSMSKNGLARAISRVYVEFFQNMPLLILVFVCYNLFPLINITLEPFAIGCIIIGLYHGAYIAEVVRSGIMSINKGQFEAAYSQGFTYLETMRYIILPQMLTIVLPPTAVQAANLVKNTSVLAMIAGHEIMYAANSYGYSTLNYGPPLVTAGILYFIICFPISTWAKKLERKRDIALEGRGGER
jgi:putative glutamine transport system permease protein